MTARTRLPVTATALPAAGTLRKFAARHRPDRGDGAAGRHVYSVVAGELARQIAAGTIPPGSLLQATAVAAAFRISRAPAAMALDRLAADGLAEKLPRRGYRVSGPATAGAELAPATLAVPAALIEALARRRRSEQAWPVIEREVAASLFFGRFRLSETRLAEHLGVSRTVAHEVAGRLQEAGLIERGRNGRWYAGPLTADGVRAHFEVRWLMEPTALIQAAPRIDPRRVDAMRRRLDRARDGLPPKRLAEEMHALERELHVELVLDCDNPVMRRVLYRSQLPLISSHYTFELYGRDAAVPSMLDEHAAVLDRLAEGDTEGAAAALGEHLRKARDSTLGRLSRMGTLPRRRLPPFLIPDGHGSPG